MNRLLVLLTICVSSCFVARGQGIDSAELYLIEYQRIAFVTSDSTYNFTRFIEPNGNFYFRDGYSDSALEEEEDSILYLKKRKKIDVFNYKYHFQPDIDTIDCIIPVNIIAGEGFQIREIAEKLNASYILSQLGESKLEDVDGSVIRLLDPCERLNYCRSYRIIKINISEYCVTLNIIDGISIDSNGVQPVRESSFSLKKGDAKRLKKQLEQLKDIKNLECLLVGNPWVMEYNRSGIYNNFIISDYCLRSKNKEVKSITRICFFISGLSKGR